MERAGRRAGHHQRAGGNGDERAVGGAREGGVVVAGLHQRVDRGARVRNATGQREEPLRDAHARHRAGAGDGLVAGDGDGQLDPKVVGARDKEERAEGLSHGVHERAGGEHEHHRGGDAEGGPEATQRAVEDVAQREAQRRCDVAHSAREARHRRGGRAHRGGGGEAHRAQGRERARDERDDQPHREPVGDEASIPRRAPTSEPPTLRTRA